MHLYRFLIKLICTKLRNIWGKEQRENVHYFLHAFLAQNFPQKFAIPKNSQIFANKIAQKNNHPANVCTISCANFCILRKILQKFAQKSKKSYGSYMIKKPMNSLTRRARTLTESLFMHIRGTSFFGYKHFLTVFCSSKVG